MRSWRPFDGRGDESNDAMTGDAMTGDAMTGDDPRDVRVATAGHARRRRRRTA
jgi:hypothetical protein